MAWPEPMPIVEITWVDSTGLHGWRGADKRAREVADPEEMLCRSVGYLFRSDDDQVVLTLGQSAQGHVDSAIQIPRCAVRSVRTIQEGTDA